MLKHNTEREMLNVDVEGIAFPTGFGALRLPTLCKEACLTVALSLPEYLHVKKFPFYHKCPALWTILTLRYLLLVILVNW